MLWYNQESIEGFVLALLNISQLYSAVNMNLAAKYYALAASWACIHNGSRYLLKRIADAFGFVFYSDLEMNLKGLHLTQKQIECLLKQLLT